MEELRNSVPMGDDFCITTEGRGKKPYFESGSSALS
jgi:hypothetical protein